MTVPTPRASSKQNQNDSAQLIEGCRYCIYQCGSLLNTLSQGAYVDTSAGASVGVHMRHVLERFQSFFCGQSKDCIDYDNRRRDKSIEINIEAANFALALIARQLEKLQLNGDRGHGILVQESVQQAGPAVVISSTIERELMGLITHTTHHLAIIALLIKPLGYSMDQDFGKAASTIRYERQA